MENIDKNEPSRHLIINDALRIVGEKMIETINRFNNLKRKGCYSRMEMISSNDYEAKSYWMNILVNPLFNKIIPEGIVYNRRLKGKSGCEIFFDGDFCIAVKTIRKKEFECFGEIIEKYVKYQQMNPQTLLVKYYGVYHIKIVGGREFYFVVMKNIFEGVYDKIYDLKGLNVNRANDSGILTENDLKLKGIPSITNVSIIKNATKDSNFLQELGLIDYSIVIGVNKLNDKENDVEKYDDFYYVNENECKKYKFQKSKKIVLE